MGKHHAKKKGILKNLATPICYLSVRKYKKLYPRGSQPESFHVTASVGLFQKALRLNQLSLESNSGTVIYETTEYWNQRTCNKGMLQSLTASDKQKEKFNLELSFQNQSFNGKICMQQLTRSNMKLRKTKSISLIYY